MSANFKKIQSGISLVAQAADPGSATNGDFYFNSVSQKLKVYSSGAWVEVVSGTSVANTALSNLASVAINTSLVSDTDNTDDLGTDSIEWKDLWIYAIKHNSAGTPTLAIQTTGNNGSLNLIAHGTGKLDVQATMMRRSENGASSNYVEEQYFDALTLAANTSSATAISSLTFAHASFIGVTIDYMIKEATSLKTRTGRLYVATDGTTVSAADEFAETAVLGSALGLSLSAAVNGANIEIKFIDTHATNACTMRCLVRRIRA